MKSGVFHGCLSELDRLVELGVCDRKTTGVDKLKDLNSAGSSGKRLYYLNEAVFPQVEQALKQILGLSVYRKMGR